jgi:hypothetical protein
MRFGATIMDTRPTIGRNPNIQNATFPNIWTPNKVLEYYPEIHKYEQGEIKKPKVDLSMACLWNTGFTTAKRGSADPEYMCVNSKNYLEGVGVYATDTMFTARPDSVFVAFMSHLSWYKSNNKVIVPNTLTKFDDYYNKVVDREFVASGWAKNPAIIRYVTRISKNSNANGIPFDYVYYVGGSEDVIGDDLDNIPNNLAQLYSQIKVLKDDAKKAKIVIKNKTEDEYAMCDAKNLWFAYNKTPTNPLIKAHLLGKTLIRTVESIILIHNYLYYLKNFMGWDEISEIVEVDPITNKPTFKEVSVDELIKKYDRIYAYCKNLTHIYKDIGEANII